MIKRFEWYEVALKVEVRYTIPKYKCWSQNSNNHLMILRYYYCNCISVRVLSIRLVFVFKRKIEECQWTEAMGIDNERFRINPTDTLSTSRRKANYLRENFLWGFVVFFFLFFFFLFSFEKTKNSIVRFGDPKRNPYGLPSVASFAFFLAKRRFTSIVKR